MHLVTIEESKTIEELSPILMEPISEMLLTRVLLLSPSKLTIMSSETTSPVFILQTLVASTKAEMSSVIKSWPSAMAMNEDKTTS